MEAARIRTVQKTLLGKPAVAPYGAGLPEVIDKII
jgi:hypothetical protein